MELDGNIVDRPRQAIAGLAGRSSTPAGTRPAGLPPGTLDTTGVSGTSSRRDGPDSRLSRAEQQGRPGDRPERRDSGAASRSRTRPTRPTSSTPTAWPSRATPQTGDGDTADDQLFYFGVERFDNSGDAFIGLWLFQDDVGCTADGKFVGSKQTGDILVLANFTGGGSNATIQLFRYTAGVGRMPARSTSS